MEKKIKAIIIDDEILSREKIKILAKEHSDLEIVAEGKDTRQAKKLLDKFKPDLMFLDIKMPEQSGIDFLASLGNKAPFVIFTTAFGDFAFEAFELNAVHYLLKPFDQKKFSDAIKRATERINLKSSKAILSRLKEVIDSEVLPENYIDKLSVKTRNKIILVSLSDIFYLQADKNYVLINTESSQYRIREKLGNIQKKLNPIRFIRVHKSYIVNKDFIIELEPVFNQEYLIKLSSGKKIPTGLAYKDNVKKLIV